MGVIPANLTDLIGQIETVNPRAAQPRKALVWGRNDLLVKAISSCLAGRTWTVVQVTSRENAEHLIRETRRIQPQVVILCQDKAGEDPRLAGRLIDEQLCLKVVTLGLDSNIVHVYSRQNIVLQGASDLLSIIEPASSPNCTEEKEVNANKETFHTGDS